MNKQDFLNAIKGSNPPVAIEIESLGVVYLKKLTVAEQGQLAKKTDDSLAASLDMVAFSLCDESGKRLFDDKDAKQLGSLSASQLTDLANAISELNGFDVQVDELKKD